MKEIEFNLLDEKWILVRQNDDSIREVSLVEALLSAHEERDLAGETPMQDAAVLRLLLAVVHTVFSRVDKDGKEEPFEEAGDALDRWESLWAEKCFPQEPLKAYFAQWHERFWLFHPDRPFWQIPKIANGTSYKAAKLNGEVLESENKKRLFASCAGAGKEALTYAQAARGLVSINGYDDVSGKPKEKDETSSKEKSSPGVGWLGKIGYIQVQGENLFETLMLNLTLLKDGETLWEEENIPCWELETVRSKERQQVSVPENQAALLTLQSRRILLKRENEMVTGYSLLGGDFFEGKNAYAEQMTVWCKAKSKRNEPIAYQPDRHKAEKQFWQEFPTIFSEGDNQRSPGVVRWITALQGKQLDKKRLIQFRITAVQYGDKNSLVADSFSDTLSFHTALLSDVKRPWRNKIAGEIKKVEALAENLEALAKNLARADRKAGTRLFYEINQPFREWLYTLEPETDDIEERITEWRKIAERVARQLGEQMVREAGPAAWTGRIVEKKSKSKSKNNEKGELYTAPRAYNEFLNRIRTIYPERGGAR